MRQSHARRTLDRRDRIRNRLRAAQPLLRGFGAVGTLKRMRCRRRHARRALLLAIALGAARIARGTEATGGDRLVEYQNDRLSVRLEHAPLHEVLQELSRQTGATVRGEATGADEATIEFHDVPLNEGLQRLLGNQNFTLVYDAYGNLRTVRLFGGPQEVIAAPGEGTAAGLVALFRNHAPVSVSGRLAKVVGGPTATFQRLGRTAVDDDDQAVRAEALGAIVTAVEADPELKDGVVSIITAMDDLAIASSARVYAGNRATDLLSAIAARTAVPAARVRAKKALRVLTGAKH
jgi:hypothetical protein